MSDRPIGIGDLVMDSGMWDPQETRLGVIVDYGGPKEEATTENQRLYAILWSDGTTGIMKRWMIKKAIK